MGREQGLLRARRRDRPAAPRQAVKAAELHFATRDFAGALRQLDASLQVWPEAPDNLPFIAKKALIYQALGRLDDAGALLDGLHPQPDGELVEPIVVQAVLRRRHDDAIRLLDDLLKRDQAEGSVGRTSIDLNIYLGQLAPPSRRRERRQDQLPRSARRTPGRVGETTRKRRHPFLFGAGLLRPWRPRRRDQARGPRRQNRSYRERRPKRRLLSRCPSPRLGAARRPGRAIPAIEL